MSVLVGVRRHPRADVDVGCNAAAGHALGHRRPEQRQERWREIDELRVGGWRCRAGQLDVAPPRMPDEQDMQVRVADRRVAETGNDDGGVDGKLRELFVDLPVEHDGDDPPLVGRPT